MNSSSTKSVMTKGIDLKKKYRLRLSGSEKNLRKIGSRIRKYTLDASIIPELEKIYYAHVDKPVDDHPDAQQLFYGNVNVYADKLENVKAVSTASERRWI